MMVAALLLNPGKTIDNTWPHPMIKAVFLEIFSSESISAVLNTLSINPNLKVSELTENHISSLREILETDEFKLEGDLKRLVSLNIKRLIDINSYRGRRHLKGLPVRGQRTRTNNRTSRRQSIFIRNK